MGGRLLRLNVFTGLFSGAVIGLIALIAITNWLVNTRTSSRLYTHVENTPYNKVGLLLGTSKYAREGGYNDHYVLRLKAAYHLYTRGKIEYILISGDNGTPYYDEPSTIRKDLLKMGIPKEKIYRDYAGFRTLDSILRAKFVFGLNEFTVISQAYHNKRALYIAQNKNINAIAFNAGDGTNSDLNNKARETLARVLAVLEVHWFNTGPKYLGPMIDIGHTPPT